MSDVSVTITRRADRIYVRMPINIVVESQGAPVSHVATTVDFSVCGARVQTDAALVQGEQVQFILSGRKHPPLPSRVAWAKQPRPHQLQEAGLEFLQPLQLSS